MSFIPNIHAKVHSFNMVTPNTENNIKQEHSLKNPCGLKTSFYLFRNSPDYSVTSFSAVSLSADLGLVWLNVSSQKIHLVRI